MFLSLREDGLSRRPKVPNVQAACGIRKEPASGLRVNLSNYIRESEVPKERATGFPVAFSFPSSFRGGARLFSSSPAVFRRHFCFRAHENAPSSCPENFFYAEQASA